MRRVRRRLSFDCKDASVKIRSPLLMKIGAFAAVWMLKAIFKTTKVHFHSRPGTNPSDKSLEERFIYCIWHDEFLVPTFVGGTKPAALVSKHHDGSFLASAFEVLDIKPIRGSSSRGGAEAIKQLIELVDDRHICITPDGPRGPRHKLKAGIVFIASKAGRRIVPSIYAADREWRIKGSWTDQMIPKPFSNVHLFTADAIDVPADLSREQIDHFVDKVQAEMDQLYEKCQRFLSGEEVERVEKRRAA